MGIASFGSGGIPMARKADCCAWSEHLAGPGLSWARSADRDAQVPQPDLTHASKAEA
jgi:hypothetical protein